MPGLSRSSVFLFCIAVALLTTPAEGRVFMKIRGDADVVMSSSGGSTVYESNIEVNGRAATLRVYSFKEGSEAVGAHLLRRFGLDASAMLEGAMVKLPKRYGASWLFLLPGMTDDVSSVILIESAESFASGTPQWAFPELPQPPGFSAEFSAVDKESRFVMCSGSSAMPAPVALSVMRGILERDGWVSATPAKDKVSSLLFAKGDDVALACTIPQESGSSLLVMKSRRK